MSKEEASSKLFWNLFFVYTANIIGKTSFSAATAALINEAILTKTQAGMISGAFWFLYAIGQFAGGFIANRMSSYTMINITILGATISNLLIPFVGGFGPMLLLWSLNGIVQFGMWPAVLKLVSTEIVPRQRSGAMGRLAFCYCLGSIVSYVVTAGILAFFTWEYVFICCGVVNGISLIGAIYAWKKCSPILQENSVQREKAIRQSDKLTWRIVWESGLIFFCILMVIKAVADNGIKSWMPTIMMETYGATPSFTSLLSVVLLVTNILGVVISAYIYERVRSDELKTLIILYIMIMPMMMLLLNFKNMNIFLMTVFMSAITVLIYGSGQVLQMHYPGRFHRWGLTASIGGIINCFAALGNVAATYGGGYIADHFGWNVMIGIWNVLIIIFVVITISIMPIWKKFRRKE